MTPEERQLISDLFDRLRSYSAPDKDREAEDFINRSVRSYPDAPYLLVQSVLVQEQALQQADERIRDLEARVRELEGPPARQGGSFLGGLLGGNRAPDTSRSSVPQVGARATGSTYDAPRPWSQQAGQQPQAPQQQGGSFMRTALSAAAGVAGGMLLADGIRSMMGGNAAHASGLGGQGSQGSPTGDSDAGYSKEHGFVNDGDDVSDSGGFDSGDMDI